jgi:phenylalanyl-tRNA synthetase beta chain
VLNAYGLKQPAYVFELDAAGLEELAAHTHGPLQVPKFPAIARDITLVLDANVEAQQLLEAVRAMDLGLLESAHLFDVFTGGPIAAGKRSLSLRLTYRSADRTLEDAEVNGLHQTVTERLLAEFKAGLPG